MVPTQNPRPAVLPPLPVQDYQTEDLSDVPLLTDRDHRPDTFGKTPLALAFWFVKPTWRNYVQFVEMEARTGNEDAARYLSVLLSLPVPERKSHYPEQICELANVSADHLMRWVAGNGWLSNDVRREMCLAFLSPDVLVKSAEFAMAAPENYKHAEIFLKSARVLQQGGAVPRRGAATAQPNVNFYNMPVASSGSVAGVKSESAPVERSGLRDMDTEIVELSKIMQSGPIAVPKSDERDEPEESEEDDNDDGPDEDDDDED